MVQQILVYADSLSWGIIPGTRNRLAFADRWPGALELGLNANGQQVRVIENCLNGRRTAWEDPFKPGRNGLTGIGEVIEMHSPLDLVILMLGTNDFQSMHPHNAWHASQGIQALVTAIRMAPVEPGMAIPPILIVAPPPIFQPRGQIAPKFSGGAEKCVGLAESYSRVAGDLRCDFFDAADSVSSSSQDGVHLDREMHHLLAAALVKKVAPILN